MTRLLFRATIVLLSISAVVRSSRAESVTLQWDRASSHTNLANFVLKYGATSGSYTGSVNVATNLTSTTVNNLSAGRTYFFVVVARNVLGVESDPSNETSHTVPGTIVNATPLANSASASTAEDTSTAITLAGSDIDDDALLFSVVTPPANGTLPGTPPNVTYQPANNFNGTDTFTFRVNDGITNSALATITITVNAANDAPTLNALASLTLATNAPLQTVSLAGIGSGAANESQTLTVSASSSNPTLIPTPTISYTSPNATGSLTFTPANNASGSSTITVTVNDGQPSNNTFTRTFAVTVGSSSGGALFIEAEDGTVVAPMAALTDASASGGTYVSSDSAEAGVVTLNFSIAQASDYYVWCRVLSVDAGADSFYVGVDAGEEDTYSTSPNAWLPTWQWTRLTGFTAGDPRILTLGVGAHTIAFRCREFATGLDAIYITSDPNFTPPSGTPNRRPTLTAIANVTLTEDAAQQTVNLAGITAGTGETQPLTATASSSNPGLIPTPAITYTSPNATGTLRFTPPANSNGTATITVTVDDGQSVSNTFTRTFTVTVNAVNDAPSLSTISNVTIGEDSGNRAVNLTGIGSGAANESQSLTITASSSNPSLIPTPTVTYTSPGASGSIAFTPVANASGTATLTVTVNDGQAANNTIARTFIVTVSGTNDLPTLSNIANQTVAEGSATAAVPFTIGDLETAAASLTVAATSSDTTLVPNANIVLGGTGASRTVRVTPAAGRSGSATVTVTVTDANGGTASDSFLLTVTPVNQPPTLNTLASLTISEDAALQTVNLAGIGTGSVDETETLTITAVSSNPGFIPTPSVNYASPNATGTLTFTPTANSNGTVTITVTVNDGQASSNTVSRAFTVTVNAVNDTPTLNAINNVTVGEDSGNRTLNLSGISAGAANESQTLTVTAISSDPSLIPTPTVNYTSPNATATVTFRPVTNSTGTATVTVTVNDGQAANNTFPRTFTVTISGTNDAPAISNIANQTVNESAATPAISFTVADVETPAGTLTLNGTSSNLELLPNNRIVFGGTGSGRTVTLTPTPTLFGSAVITVTVTDANGATATDTFTLTVTPVNQSPTLNPLTDLTLAEDSGLRTVNLSGITTGATNETDALIVTATSSNPSLIPAPTVAYTSPNFSGSIAFTPVANASGSAILTVTVNDGQAQNAAFSRTFTVTVTNVNDLPTLSDITDQTVTESASTAALPFTIGDLETAVGSLNVVAVSSNPTLVPNANIVLGGTGASRTVRITPAATRFGNAVITVTVTDASGGSATDSFLLTVTPVNQAPTLNTLASLTINEDAALQTVNLAGISTGSANETDTLTVTATSSNPSLVPHPAVNYSSPGATGFITFTPVANANGSAVITVSVNDGQASSNTVSRTFTVTVTSVNDVPTLAALDDLPLTEDSPAQIIALSGISAGAVNESQTLTVTATSSTPSVVPHPTVTYSSPSATGSISLKSATNATGSAVITVSVSDGQNQNATVSRTFIVDVSGINDPPTVSAIADQSLNENQATAPLPFSIGDTETPAASLVVAATSSNPTLVPTNGIVLGGSAASRTITVTPAANQSGNSIITLTVTDANNGTATEVFTVFVNAVNQPPTLDPINPVALNEDAPAQTVELAGISTGAFDELQTLTVTATSSNPSLIPAPTVAYTSPNFSGSIAFTPVANASGSATISVSVNDGQSQNNSVVQSFIVTVNPVNDSPNISNLADQTIDQDTSTATLPFTIGDAETPIAGLSIAANSSNPSLVPNANIVLGGSSSNRTVRVTPLAGQYGSAIVTITVADGTGGVNSDSFILTVNTVNFPPTLDDLTDMTLVEDSGVTTVALTGISSGSSDESQPLVVTASASDTNLFSIFTVSHTSPEDSGTLTFAPFTNAFGSSVITVTVSDGQQRNSTTTKSFLVTINPVNDAPTLDALANVLMVENAPTHSVPLLGIHPGAANEVPTLVVTATSSNPGLIPDPTVTYFSPNTSGSLAFTPAADANGTATITVTVDDGASENNLAVRSFTVTVSGVNSAPTISAFEDRSIPMNGIVPSVPFVIGDAESPAESLRVTVYSSNPSLVHTNDIVMSGTGSNRVTSIITTRSAHGYTVITYTVSDTNGASSSSSFVLTVVPPNTQPTLDPIASRFVAEDGGPQVITLTGISAGGNDENQTLIVSAVSMNPGVIPHPIIDYTSPNTSGTLTFSPASNANGSATIVVTVNDGQNRDFLITRTFGISITEENDAPTISSIPNQVVEQSTPTSEIPFIVSDRESPADNLSLAASSSDQTLVPDSNIHLAGSGANRTIRVTPAALRSGTAIITVFASDGASSASTSFQITVGNGNTAPAVAAPVSQAADSYTESAIAFTVSDRESRADDLLITAASANPTVVPDANLRLSGSGSNRVLRARPVAGSSGSVNISIGVSDGKAITRRTVTLNVAVGNAPTDRLSIRRNGEGTVKPALDGQFLTVGKTYTITALPAANEVFYGWSRGATSSLPKLTFVMVSNLVLEVTFTNNPYLDRKGSYSGLFFETTDIRVQSSGSFTVTPTIRGTYSGKLKLGAASHPLSGAMDLLQKATNNIARKNTNALVVELDFGSITNQVVGRVSDGTWEAPLLGDRAVFNTKTNLCPFIGSYTIVIPGQDSAEDGPQGDGFGTIKVDGNGLASLAGTLADGTKFAAKTPLSGSGQWPVHVPIAGNGELLSWMNYTKRPADDLTGLLSWIKPVQPKGKYHAGGFTNESMAIGSSFIRPTNSSQPILELANPAIVFSGGNLAATFANNISWGEKNKVTNLGSNKLTLTVSATSGLFSGRVTDPNTGKSSKFSGAVLQKLNTGSGFLLGTNASSLVSFGDFSN